jgi:acetyl-CoA C-acetyltransferase
MLEAVIISTARTPIGKAYRGSFNDTQGQALAGHAIREAVLRAGISPAEVEDVAMGCALQQGSTGFNVARQGALWGGLPESVPGSTIDRQCGSGLMAIASAAHRIMVGEQTIAVAGGVESISLVQGSQMNHYRARDPKLAQEKPALYMSMLETAEIVRVPVAAANRPGAGRRTF